MKKWLFPAVALLSLTACSTMEGWFDSEEEAPLEGERLAVLAEGSQAMPAADAGDVAITLPAESGGQIWAQAGRNAGNHAGNLSVAGALRSEDSASAGGGEGWDLPFASQPVADASRVYAMDAAGNVSAHARAGLGEIWRYSLPDEWSKPMAGGGLVVAADRLYAVSGSGVVTALQAEDGKQIWQRNIGAIVRAEPKLHDGRIYVMGADNQLIAMSAEDGSILWKHQGINEGLRVLSSLPAALHDTLAVVPYASGELYALDAASSRERWRDMVLSRKRVGQASEMADFAAPPMIAFPKLLVGGRGGLMAAMDVRSGMRVWEREFPSIQHFWLADGVLLVLTAHNQLAAVNTDTGRIHWTASLPFDGEANQPSPWRFVMMAGGKVLVTSTDGNALWLNVETGALQGEIPWPDGAFSLPIALEDGWYLVTRSAKLVKLQ